MKRKALVVTVSGFGLLCVGAVLGVLVSSYGPSAEAYAENFPGIDVAKLAEGEEKLFKVDGMPVMVRRLSGDSFDAYLAVAQFEDSLPRGCVIDRYKGPRYGNHETVFYEVCHSIAYDKDGKVVNGPSGARPMKMYRSEFKHGFLFLHDDS